MKTDGCITDIAEIFIGANDQKITLFIAAEALMNDPTKYLGYCALMDNNNNPTSGNALKEFESDVSKLKKVTWCLEVDPISESKGYTAELLYIIRRNNSTKKFFKKTIQAKKDKDGCIVAKLNGPDVDPGNDYYYNIAFAVSKPDGNSEVFIIDPKLRGTVQVYYAVVKHCD